MQNSLVPANFHFRVSGTQWMPEVELVGSLKAILHQIIVDLSRFYLRNQLLINWNS